MSRKKSSYISTDKFDSNILYFTITAIMLISYLIRIKVFKNIYNFDMRIIPSAANFYTYYKLVFLIALVSILLVLFIYRIAKYKVKIRTDYIFIGTGLIILASLISTLLSSQSDIAVIGIYTRTNGLLTYLSLFLMIYILSNLKVQAKHLQFLVHMLNIASIGFVIIAIFQFFGLEIMNALWFKKLYTPANYKHIIDNVKITTFSYPNSPYFWASSLLAQFNYFGAYCSIIFPLIANYAISEFHIYKKLILSFGSVMLFTGVILAQSLGSWVALLGVILLIPFLMLNKANYKGYLWILGGCAVVSTVLFILTKGTAFDQLTSAISRFGLSIKIVLLLAFAVLYTVILFLWTKLSKKRFFIVSVTFIIIVLIFSIGFMYFINNITHDTMGVFSARGYIWHYTNEMIKQNFIIGYGPDSIFYNFPQLNPDKAEFMPDAYVDKPHNMYLQLIIDIGIFGLIGFMIILIVSFIKYTKAIETETDTVKVDFLKGMQLVIFAYMIQGIVNDNHLVVQPILYMLIGISIALVDKVSIFKTTDNKINN